MFKQVKTGLIHQQKLTQQQQRSVTSSKLIIDDFVKKDRLRKTMVNLYGQRDGNLGVVKMNREHRYNTLTQSLITDIERGIDTMNNDHTLHAIFLGTEKGQHWSHGSDFKSILYMKNEDNYTKIQEYMNALYHLQTNIASINKPLIAVAPGHAMNSGAAILAAVAHPLTTVDSKIAFNEVSFGFVPHAGATFYMSRMPGEFGTFMALTGMSIRGSDAAVIDIARGIVHNIENYSQEVADHVSALPFPIIGGEHLFRLQKEEEVFVTPWQYHVRERQHELEKLKNVDTNKMFRQQRDLLNFDPLLDPKDRTPSSVAEANYRYMKMIRNEAKANEPEELGYLEFGEHATDRSSAFIYSNYFNNIMSFVGPRIGDAYSTCNSVAVLNKQLIDRCFYSNSVEEIMENLKKETHPFALKMLNAMKRNSPQSMQLALQMVRKAQNLDYKGCLQMELNVAFNRIQDAEFDLGVQKVLQVASDKVKGKPIPEWGPYLKQSELDRYFEDSVYAKGVNLQVVENALLPTKNYYQRFSDQVRLWLNETSATQPHVREVFELEAKQALQEQGIDVRDLALTPEIARNHMYAKIAKERALEVYGQRAEQLMTDQKLRDEYFQKINKEVEKFDKDDAYFYNTVNSNISNCFQDAYLGRLDHVFKKSSEAHNLEKRRLLIRMKKFFFKQRILAYNQEHSDRQIEQLKSMPFQQIHMSEKWDQSFRDQQHPDLHRSPLYYLSKVIGRVSITPPELTKAYITEPEKRNQLTMFTLNKSELEKLNEDVLANPEKYEMIFCGNDVPEIDNFKIAKAQRDLALNKLDEYEYWYRVLNDGYCQIDTWTYNAEFRSYKEWAELIETKAMNTLRTAINKLIMDHENSTEFSGSLKNLIKFVNDPSKSEQKKKSHKIVGVKLGDSTRNIDDLNGYLNDMLKNDPYLGHLFKPDRDSHNEKVKAIRNEFKSELLKLIEIVLLDKTGPVCQQSKDELEKRLADLTNPQTSIERSLNLIDQHLAQKNGEALVKDAFELVTPFFVKMMQTRLNQEVSDLLSEFQYEKNKGDILVFYFMSKSFPNIKKNAALKKFMTYSLEQDIYDQAIKRFPYMTERFQRRELLAMLGGEDIIKRPTLGETMYDSLQKTNEELKQFEIFDQSVARDGKFKLATDAEQEKFQQLSDIENLELAQIQSYMCDIYEFLFEHKYEIDHHMNDFDALQIISESIKNYDLDVASLTESHNKKHYQSLANYAVFVAELVEGLNMANEQHTFDAVSFMEQQNSGKEQQESFYLTARAERDRLRQTESELSVADRHSIIKQQIKDFNQLKNQVQSHKEVAASLANIISKQKLQTQNEINNFLNNTTNVDLELLARKIKKGDFKFLKHPEQVVDIEKTINQTKQSFERFESAVDVISLHQLKGIIQQDNELSQEQKQSLRFIVDYVMEQTKYLSNADRKNLKIKDFLEKHHFSNHQAYLEYTSDLLKSKIEALLGKTDSSVPDIVEWQLANTRTLPSEHTTNQLDAELRFECEPEDVVKILARTGIVEEDEQDEMDNSDNMKEDRKLQQIVNAAVQQASKVYKGKKDKPVLDVEVLDLKLRQSTEGEDEKIVSDDDQDEDYSEAGQQKALQELYETLNSSDPESESEMEDDEDEEPKSKSKSEFESKFESKPEAKAESESESEPESEQHLGKIDAVLNEMGWSSELSQADYVRLKNVQYTNPDTGNEEVDTHRTYENKSVMREALELSEIPHSMIPTKNLYEHKILKEMIEIEMDEAEISRIIEEYTNIRLQGCLLNKKFATALQQENASIYMKVLREKIVEELGLAAPAQGYDLSYYNLTDEFKNQQFYDIENAYNMQSVNNTNAIGYDNLLKRAQSETAADNFNAAHESVFDKLLADYYLDKRGEYKESNKLLQELSKIFEDPTAKMYGTSALSHLEQTKLKQNIDKGDHPLIRTESFREMIKLDVVTSQAMQKNKNGLSESLRALSITEKDHPDWWSTQVPQYFEVMDVRKPADLYVQDKLNSIIQECFQLRAKLEKKMTRHELIAFDNVLARYLQKDKLMPRLKHQIESDYNLAHSAKSLVNMHKDNKADMEVHNMKLHHNQRDYNKKIKNEDAEFKLLAYSAMLDRKNQKDSLTKQDTLAMYNTTSFEEYYKQELVKESQKEPRPINPKDYQARKPWDKPVGTPFRDKNQRIADLELDFSIYNEKKLEQQDRIQLFYTLEQYYEQARKNPDPNSKGEQLIREYFADPENTFFFDKNKLM